MTTLDKSKSCHDADFVINGSCCLAMAVVVWTGTVSDDKVGIMMTPSFQWGDFVKMMQDLKRFNSLSLYDVYMSHQPRPSLVQILACRLFGAKTCANINYRSRGFETSRDLMIRCLIEYWKRALVPSLYYVVVCLLALVHNKIIDCMFEVNPINYARWRPFDSKSAFVLDIVWYGIVE